MIILLALTSMSNFVTKGIMHFPYYLSGVQDHVERILKQIHDEDLVQKIIFVPVHDGGIRKFPLTLTRRAWLINVDSWCWNISL